MAWISFHFHDSLVISESLSKIFLWAYRKSHIIIKFCPHILILYGTVGASSSGTRRVFAEIAYVIYHAVWAVFILEYKLEG